MQTDENRNGAEGDRAGLEYANAIISDGGLIMTRDLPDSEVSK